MYNLISSVVERQAGNKRIMSSSPAWSKTIFPFFISFFCAVLTPKVGKTGENYFKSAQKKERKKEKKVLPKAGLELTTLM